MASPLRPEKKIKRLVKFLERPRTREEIKKRFKIRERQVYRWFSYAHDLGHDIVSFSVAKKRVYLLWKNS